MHIISASCWCAGTRRPSHPPLPRPPCGVCCVVVKTTLVKQTAKAPMCRHPLAVTGLLDPPFPFALPSFLPFPPALPLSCVSRRHPSRDMSQCYDINQS